MPPRRLLRWLTLEILILASIGTLLGLLLGSLLAPRPDGAAHPGAGRSLWP